MAWKSYFFPLMFTCASITVYSQDLDQNSNVTPKNSATLSPIEQVIFNLENDANFGDVQNVHGESLLIGSVKNGNLSKVRDFFTKVGPTIDLLDGNGWTALMWAVSKNFTDISIYLINSGANVNIRNTNFGDTSLIMASSFGNLKLTQTLIRAGAEVNVKDFDGDAPLDTAARNGYIDVVNELIKHGADIDSQNNDGINALILAAYYNHLETVKALLRANANPNLKTKRWGETALLWAIDRGFNDIVRELIVFGADINLQNNRGLTPLGIAAILNRFEEARLLLSAGARINEQAQDGDTALMEAVNLGKVEVAKVFLEHCPNLNIINTNGKDVLTIAERRLEPELTKMIRDHPNLLCEHENVNYQSGDTRYDVCREVKCCQGIWSPTGRTLETCGDQCKKILAPAGVCTQVDNCPKLAEDVRSFLSLPDGFQRGIELIQSYGCSFFEGNTHVCCPTA